MPEKGPLSGTGLRCAVLADHPRWRVCLRAWFPRVPQQRGYVPAWRQSSFLHTRGRRLPNPELFLQRLLPQRGWVLQKDLRRLQWCLRAPKDQRERLHHRWPVGRHSGRRQQKLRRRCCPDQGQRLAPLTWHSRGLGWRPPRQQARPRQRYPQRLLPERCRRCPCLYQAQPQVRRRGSPHSERFPPQWGPLQALLRACRLRTGR
ncbi:hypothetical protein SHM7688_02579 [Shimia marina]|uniref:Uncharacterized protein n=1 Tax=Shimia marina TaxID=321267 RepID=A0A0P1ERX6_9RHOB|nr:hypothetical protein SHM7688_02579 [Shimia marina]